MSAYFWGEVMSNDKQVKVPAGFWSSLGTAAADRRRSVMRFLEALSTPGGHIAVLAGGVALGAVMLGMGITEGRAVMMTAGGALLALLRPQS